MVAPAPASAAWQGWRGLRSASQSSSLSLCGGRIAIARCRALAGKALVTWLQESKATLGELRAESSREAARDIATRLLNFAEDVNGRGRLFATCEGVPDPDQGSGSGSAGSSSKGGRSGDVDGDGEDRKRILQRSGLYVMRAVEERASVRDHLIPFDESVSVVGGLPCERWREVAAAPSAVAVAVVACVAG